MKWIPTPVPPDSCMHAAWYAALWEVQRVTAKTVVVNMVRRSAPAGIETSGLNDIELELWTTDKDLISTTTKFIRTTHWWRLPEIVPHSTAKAEVSFI